MGREIFLQAWDALRRNVVRSALTMAGIVWGIVTVTLLIAYGGGFRTVLVNAFEAFGKSTVICWPGQTSEQAGGERAGKKIRFEQADVDAVAAKAVECGGILVKHTRTKMDQGDFLYLTDPDGTRVELMRLNSGPVPTK